MSDRATQSSRIDAATAQHWCAVGYGLPPSCWASAARHLPAPTDAEAEIRVSPATLDTIEPEHMIAASALRDAGIGLALHGVARPEHLRLLRMLPWSAVIAHPALPRQIGRGPGDGMRWIGSWADAAGRRGLPFVAEMKLAELGGMGALRDAGFTHADVSMPFSPA